MLEYSSSESSNGSSSQIGLRMVYCPLEIISEFIKYASKNTDKKLETCAILAGNEKNDSLIIDTLIIPKQAGHTDHCYMTDEVSMFET